MLPLDSVGASQIPLAELLSEHLGHSAGSRPPNVNDVPKSFVYITVSSGDKHLGTCAVRSMTEHEVCAKR